MHLLNALFEYITNFTEHFIKKQLMLIYITGSALQYIKESTVLFSYCIIIPFPNYIHNLPQNLHCIYKTCGPECSPIQG